MAAPGREAKEPVASTSRPDAGTVTRAAAIPTTSERPPSETTPATATCPLCGRTFGLDEMGCHDGCPLARRCAVLCCPHCGYEFVDEAPTRRRLARIRAFWYKVTGRGARQDAGRGRQNDREEGSPR